MSEHASHYEPRGITPIIIVVADTIRNAERLFAELGGWRNRGRKVGAGANCSGVVECRRDRCDQGEATLRFSSTRGWMRRRIRRWRALSTKSDNTAVHVPDKNLTASERMDVVRKLFNTAGRPGEPGGNLRCIVSVGMLTEGWDARTVTHVVGYRNFGSELLCEQVAGRALRRSVVPEPGGTQTAEYANIVGIPFSVHADHGGRGSGKSEGEMASSRGARARRPAYRVATGVGLAGERAWASGHSEGAAGHDGTSNWTGWDGRSGVQRGSRGGSGVGQCAKGADGCPGDLRNA